MHLVNQSDGRIFPVTSDLLRIATIELLKHAGYPLRNIFLIAMVRLCCVLSDVPGWIRRSYMKVLSSIPIFLSLWIQYTKVVLAFQLHLV